ncbi:MAG: trypsin-like peptidase domain-containing protein, partial [Elusimicrobia bacterium]|nr:trypsin-like peptidase domain-containing protein [Elusimicrobiota bacterium]
PADFKARVFDLVLDLLGSDRRMPPAELDYLERLRKVCGVGFWQHQGRLWTLRRRGVSVGGRGKSAAVLFCLFGLFGWLSKDRVMPKAASSGREIHIRPLEGFDEKAPAEGDANPELVYRFVRDSFATVEVFVDGKEEAIGSASVLGEDSQGDVYFLTNRHVVDQAALPGRPVTYRLTFVPEEAAEAKLDFVSDKEDLALLRLSKPAKPRAALALRPRTTIEVGQRVFALGSPHGFTHTFTQGIVSALRDDYLQTDATVDPGSSGGPLVDGQGRLCGVVTRAHVRKNFSFAVYADSVMQALAERRQRFGPLKD